MMEKLVTGAAALGITLNPQQMEKFEVYYQQLISWNRRVNITGITAYDEIQTRHFLDSLTVVLALPGHAFHGQPSVIDIGTGAGLPGIPLKIAFPEIRLALLEATAKKTRFLGHLVETLGLSGIDIICGRAEAVAHDPRYREKFDFAVSRAVAVLPVLAELTLPFCAIGGNLIAQKGIYAWLEAEKATEAFAILGGRLKEIIPVFPAKRESSPHLVVIEKIKTTPEQYPRRPGIPSKRPLGLR